MYGEQHYRHFPPPASSSGNVISARALWQAHGRGDPAIYTHLELPEVGSRVGIVRGHAVVSQTEHQREEQTADTLRHGEERARL